MNLNPETQTPASPEPNASVTARAVGSSDWFGSGSVDHMTTAVWNALRDQCCTTKRSAKRIVMVHEHDVRAAVAAIMRPTRKPVHGLAMTVMDCPKCGQFRGHDHACDASTNTQGSAAREARSL